MISRKSIQKVKQNQNFLKLQMKLALQIPYSRSTVIVQTTKTQPLRDNLNLEGTITPLYSLTEEKGIENIYRKAQKQLNKGKWKTKNDNIEKQETLTHKRDEKRNTVRKVHESIVNIVLSDKK